MTKLLSAVLVLATLALALPIGLKLVDNYGASFTKDEKVSRAESPAIPQIPDLLKLPEASQMKTLVRLITLEKKNTAVLRGPVTGESVGQLMREISKISRNIPKSSSIYLVLDTPGGSVIDGADFIDFLNSLPQKVTTVTLFAASMGFHIVENNPGERLITSNGMLMSHRAALSGLSGQFDGELETRYRMMKRQIDMLENNVAARMGLSLTDYKAKIKDELWIHGFDSVAEKVADSEVLVKCGESYDGETTDTTFNTMFGAVIVTFDACPLIKTPVSIRMDGIQANARAYVTSILNDAFLNKQKFVKEWILTDKFHSFFP
jgi:ATP-dependent protease ClpP protease subunit